MKCSIYRINKEVPLPTKNKESDAGWDVYSPEDFKIPAGVPTVVKLGIIVRAPEGFHWKLVLRSSAAFKRGFRLINSVGIIDSSFAGPEDELGALLEYTGHNGDVGNISKGERICQLLLEKNEDVEWVEENSRDFAGNSRGGIGSSGK